MNKSHIFNTISIERRKMCVKKHKKFWLLKNKGLSLWRFLEVNQITNIRATVSSKTSAVKPCVKGTKRSHVASLLELEH